MLKEDNNGYICLPLQDLKYQINNKKTLVYIVVFHPEDLIDGYDLSKIRLHDNLTLVGDDVNGPFESESYFEKNHTSIPLSAAICIGWSERGFEYKQDKSPWVVNFRNLSYEGKKLYYSMKKLHNQKEVRILTFTEK
jgi:hypothetical protein